MCPAFLNLSARFAEAMGAGLKRSGQTGKPAFLEHVQTLRNVRAKDRARLLPDSPARI